eukprot:m.111196 g.111196  ORF g.111196 m.111196 type:complete len:173 (+) comp51818_c0_seq18:1204-1722(+)
MVDSYRRFSQSIRSASVEEEARDLLGDLTLGGQDSSILDEWEHMENNPLVQEVMLEEYVRRLQLGPNPDSEDEATEPPPSFTLTEGLNLCSDLERVLQEHQLDPVYPEALANVRNGLLTRFQGKRSTQTSLHASFGSKTSNLSSTLAREHCVALGGEQQPRGSPRVVCRAAH